MSQAPAPRPKSPFENPLLRAGLALALLALIGGATFCLSTTRGSGNPESGSRMSTPGTAGSPGPGGAALGALDRNAPVVGQPAPDFALRRADGSVVRLGDLRGRVVWVNFWATWCVPCKQELPLIQKLYSEKQSQGLEVLEVNYAEAVSDASAYFSEGRYTMPLLLDSAGSVYAQYRLNGLPDSFFIDRDGKLHAMYFGNLSEAKMRERLARAGLP